MECSREEFFCKIESMVSTLCGAMWWAAVCPSPKQTPENVPTHQDLHLGLKALMATAFEKETVPGIVHSYMVSSPASLSESSSWTSSSSLKSLPSLLPRSLSYPSSVTGDLIGTESGVYMSSYEDLVTAVEEKTKPHIFKTQNKGSQVSATRRKYLPPIPLLAGTGKLVPCMPWVLTRQYTSDGKLILREERAKYQEYLEAKREDGRLLLSLVSIDNADGDEKMDEEDVDFIEGLHGRGEKVKLVDFHDYDDDSGDDGNNLKDEDGQDDGDMMGRMIMQKGSMTTVASSMPEMSMVSMMLEKGGGVRRCFTFVDIGSHSSNMFPPMLNIISA